MNSVNGFSHSIDLDRIPSPPGVAARLLEIIDDPNVEIASIIKTISADAALSTRLISYCNSPSQRRSHETTSLQQAVTRIGSSRLKLLALSFSLVKHRSETGSFDFDRFWTKSLANAVACSALGQEIQRNNDEDFLLGLVMNLGQVALAISCPEEYGDEFQKVLGADLNSQLQREAELFGDHRFGIGATLLSKWGFPDSLCEQIRLLGKTEINETNQTRDFFVMASSIAKILYSTGENEREAVIDFVAQQTNERLQVERSAFDKILANIETSWSEYASLLGIPNGVESDTEAIELAARKKILELSLGLQDELQESRELNSKLAEDNNVDELTLLRSRRAYRRDSGKLIERATHDNDSMAVLVLDVDHFKAINDTYGHSAGDKVLQGLGAVISSNIRSYDQAYRFGGEEFVVLLSNCSFTQTLQIAERLRKAIENFSVEIGLDQTISVTASIGVSWAQPTKESKIEDYFEAADKQLYQAKRRGRNQCASEPAGVH